MNEEATLKLEARLGAIEFALCEIFSVIYGKLPAPQIHARHDQWIELLRAQGGLKDLHPVESDMLSGELENALRDLSAMIESHVQKPRPKAAN
jgi:hypothetical protein